MLSVGSEVFLWIPDEFKERVLHPGRVIEVSDSIYTAEFDEMGITPEAGQEVFVYYELRQKFMQQAARIDALMQASPKPLVGFQTTGEPVSAESREFHRVSTVMADLTASLGPEQHCQLMDVSVRGFAVVAKEKYQVGQTLPATLRFEGQEYIGKGCIQSVKELSKGRYRYGLHSVDDKKSSATLEKGQQTIAMAIQRQQLRRLAGNA